MDGGTEADFGKPTPQYKLQTPPFYAAWATPSVHDTRAGLRINAQCQMVNLASQRIPGLYCGGESVGGFNQHDLGRCTAQGYIAGTYAAAGRPTA
jgi:succinate dehydrogenase/fumarate reductase flavoprotein subunit